MNSSLLYLYSIIILTYPVRATVEVLPAKSWGSKPLNTTEIPLLEKIQKTRKTLKKLRKWRAKHRAEEKLAKCLSKYWRLDFHTRRNNDEFEYVMIEDIPFEPESRGKKSPAFLNTNFASSEMAEGRKNEKRNDKQELKFYPLSSVIFNQSCRSLTDKETRNLTRCRQTNHRTYEDDDAGVRRAERIDEKEEEKEEEEEEEKEGMTKAAARRRRQELVNPSNSDSLEIREPETVIRRTSSQRVWTALSTLWSLVTVQLYDRYLSRLWKHKLFGCIWDYSVTKFWAWVDDAPD